MLTLSEMKTQVSNRIQKSSADYLTKIEGWLNFRYDDILSRKDWPQLYRSSTFVSVANVITVIIPDKDVESIIEIHDNVNGINLIPTNPSVVSRSIANPETATGTPKNYFWKGVTVAAQPTATSIIAVKSTDASDTSQTVRLWGINSAGDEVSEQIILNGTTGVNSTNSYTRLDRASKSATTAGTISGTSNSAAVTNFEIDPNARNASHIVIQLVQKPASAITYNYTYKIKTPKLEFDDDVPIIPISNALVLGAYADALRQQKQHQKAKLLEFNPTKSEDPSTYEGKVVSMIQRFEQQPENVPLMQPHIQRSDIDSVNTPYSFRSV